LPLLCQAAPGSGQNQPGAGQRIALAQHQMRGQITGRPRRKQGRRPRAELAEQVAQLRPLSGVQEQAGQMLPSRSRRGG